MTTAFVVVQPFGSHPIGTIIDDPEEAARLLSGDHASCLVRIASAASVQSAESRSISNAHSGNSKANDGVQKDS